MKIASKWKQNFIKKWDFGTQRRSLRMRSCELNHLKTRLFKNQF